MSARHLCWLINALLVISGLLLAVAGAILLLAPWIDEPLFTSWNVVSNSPGIEVLFNTSSGIRDARLTLNSGELIVQFHAWPSWILRAADFGIMSALIFSVLWLLRRFATDVRNGIPFSPGSAIRLRRVGWLMIAFPVWQLVQSILWQILVLNHLSPVQEGVSLVSSIGRASAGDLKLLPAVNPGFAVAGLILLVVAEAFRMGISLREDSEAIV